MKPWDSAKVAELSKVRVVCLDIDETLSTRGKLTAEAFSALWSLKGAGMTVVPITGRPAGWCDHIARFWPVDAVVGENGAFVFYLDGTRQRLDTLPGAGDPKPRLDALGKKIRARFPQAKWASDQAYREFDLAIDICEDVPAWKDADVEAVLALCKAEGAHAKLSSIHVNAWFGDYDKKGGLQSWVKAGCPGSKLPAAPAWDEWLFIGDSPNDEPLFEFFPCSVGVANLSKYAAKLKHPPRWVTLAESGAGFCEMALRLVQARKGK
jgi:HAD superfamily hydrolase (TIGR01484 family)